MATTSGSPVGLGRKVATIRASQSAMFGVASAFTINIPRRTSLSVLSSAPAAVAIAQEVLDGESPCPNGLIPVYGGTQG
jgi:hypothetical protein